ncbi:N-acetyl-D-glucosamine kinase isoform X2 [Ceratina calcarata]|nr:N-acetyl-D-glucosamine kinase isoform X2 [Ceratina calcarata]XP_026668418.1 N-acetyl-D-glucosamine kinase isoform X2 [Ceratina calcarata]
MLEEEEMAKIELPEAPEEIRLGGVEGGSSQSIFIIMDGKGTILTEIKGPSTNHWALGIDETAARINAMVEKGKQAIGMSELVPLDCLGLSLSGCEEEKTNRSLHETIQEKYPATAKTFVVTSDVMGSLRTGFANGGIVLIAGTGSQAFLVDVGNKMSKCGGWGHMIADEGSAYWIAHRACKYVFDDIDGLARAPRRISYVWPAIRHHFNVVTREEFLSHLYTNFNKTHFASFAKEIVQGCEKKDSLCLYILQENGRWLAKYIIALARKAHNDLKLSPGGIKVICVGSVWKSWYLMKDAFLDEIHQSMALDELSLFHLKTTSAVGACYLAAEKVKWIFKKPYEDNIEVFHHYKRQNYVKPTSVEVPEDTVPCPGMEVRR